MGFLGTGWVVINSRLGTTTALDPDCHVVGLGPPWVLMSCPLTSNPSGAFDVELYSLVDGTRQTVTPSPGVPQMPVATPDVEAECAGADGVGAYWVRWDASCHCRRSRSRCPPRSLKPPASPEDTPVLALELSSGALYVEDGWNGTIWRAASPTALPLNARRPSLTRSGSTLTCRRGRWRNAGRFSYAWRVNGIAHKGANRTLTVGKASERRSVSCSVTASNAAGTTTASSAQLRVR